MWLGYWLVLGIVCIIFWYCLVGWVVDFDVCCWVGNMLCVDVCCRFVCKILLVVCVFWSFIVEVLVCWCLVFWLLVLLGGLECGWFWNIVFGLDWCGVEWLCWLVVWWLDIRYVFDLLVWCNLVGLDRVGFVDRCGFLLVFWCCDVVGWYVGLYVWWFCCLVLVLCVECCVLLGVGGWSWCWSCECFVCLLGNFVSCYYSCFCGCCCLWLFFIVLCGIKVLCYYFFVLGVFLLSGSIYFVFFYGDRKLNCWYFCISFIGL